MHGLRLVLVFHCLSWGGGSVKIFLYFQDQYFYPWLILWFHLRPLLSPAVHLIVGPDPRQQHRVRHRALPTWSPARPTKKLVLISVAHTNIVVAWIISRCSRLRSVHQVLDISDNDQMARFQGVQVLASSCPVRSSSFLLIALDCPPLSDEPWALSLIDTSSGHRKRHRTGNQSTHLAAHNHMLACHVSQVSQVSTGRSRSIFSVSGMSVARLGYNAGAWLDLERVCWLFVSSDKIYTASHPALRQFH